MKLTILTAAIIAVSQLCFARTDPANARVPESIPPLNELLTEIIKVTGLKADFELIEDDVLNIEATISHRKRIIRYNPSFIQTINRLVGNKWGATFLLAHEIGHHLNGHTLKKTGSTPSVELEADEFAGYVLFQLGATLEQSQEIMKYIARINPSATHPGRVSRMSAVKKGWEKASARLAYL